MYDATEVAWKMLKAAAKKEISLSNLQLQKLVYIAHGYMLGWKNKPLCTVPMEAWEYGPVVSEVYHLFKDNGKNPIPVNSDVATDLDGDADAEYIIDGVIENFGKKSAPELVSLTHQKNTPWDITWRKTNTRTRSVPIDNDLIKNHFRKVISPSESVVGL